MRIFARETLLSRKTANDCEWVWDFDRMSRACSLFEKQIKRVSGEGGKMVASNDKKSRHDTERTLVPYDSRDRENLLIFAFLSFSCLLLSSFHVPPLLHSFIHSLHSLSPSSFFAPAISQSLLISPSFFSFNPSSLGFCSPRRYHHSIPPFSHWIRFSQC